jgi:hypothetical protein
VIGKRPAGQPDLFAGPEAADGKRNDVIVGARRNLIAGTCGCRKLRLPGRGKGKSGGYRVVTFYSGVDIPPWTSARYLSRRIKATEPKLPAQSLPASGTLLQSETADCIHN